MLILDLILLNLWCLIGGLLMLYLDHYPDFDNIIEEFIILLLWPAHVVTHVVKKTSKDTSGASGDSGVDLDRDSDHLH